MIHLEPVNPDNWREPLAVREDQRHFVSDGAWTLARAWAYREYNSVAKVIYSDDEPVGMLMYYDWQEEKMYVFSQLFIDRRWQGRGFGRRAVELALDEMRAAGRYSRVVLCYVEGDEPAMRLYQSLGFVHTGEADEGEIEMLLEHL